MKPAIDLTDPAVQAFIHVYRQRCERAFQAATPLEESVCPIYAIVDGDRLPTHIGSCVILSIGDHVFLLSAAHVFEPIGQFAVLVGKGQQLHSLVGDRFSSARGPSNSHSDDNIDAAVFHILEDVPPEIRSAALPLSSIDLFPFAGEHEVHVVIGYRTSASTRLRRELKSKREKYPSCEPEEEEYLRHSIRRDTHLALTFENEVLTHGRWQSAPSLHGLSGGAIIRVGGLFKDPKKDCASVPAPCLTAIVTERRPKKNEGFPVLVGSRIWFHIGLIERYLPGLIKESLG